ncbi:alpha/beta fold hydrolase [Planosporangium mesophilum]|uniref:Alpha/beta hydrolase n=1 Tax=Planosporangium mesophilum TaxID=689768 RepID=A0A8J3WXZ9_9ACTN|nr:alpha/beta fold hydrolase [Planosporangium mesophilum]NJC81677.1 alpha/beta hydrolase [Planosporangium mesophilum]GII20662.1 alpha/beta hydrolase [Planosporangium mesophilum]
MRRQLLALLAVTAVTAVLTPATPGHAAAKPPALSWGACPPAEPGVERDPRQQCATLRVPLDYRRPQGRQIDIAVSRIPTAKPGLRHGILLFNPGGPGGSGLDFPGMLLPLLPADVTDRFDLIGFDPRGIANSTPVTCGIDPNTPTELILPYPAPDGSIGRNVAYARRTAADCARLSGDLLPYLTTANTARDMDRIRAALGEPKLSYLGYSYGTYLGAVFTSLFGAHSDRIVLDSAVDPTKVWYDMWRTWGSAIALRLPDFTKWAADRDATYQLGATPQAVEHTYYELAARFDRDPLDIGGLVVTGNLFREITRSALYNDHNFPDLASIWQTLAQAPATKVGSAAEAMRQLLAPAPAAAQVPVDNGVAALYSVVCDDAAWPREPGVYARNVAVGRRLFPATAGMPDNIWPCAFWKNGPVEPPVKVTDKGPRNVLILQNLRDPATSWSSGFGLRRALGQRADFISVDQGGHGVYLLTQAPCANDVATAFLAHGNLPARDAFCPGQSPGDVTGLTTVPRVKLPGPLG